MTQQWRDEILLREYLTVGPCLADTQPQATPDYVSPGFVSVNGRGVALYPGCAGGMRCYFVRHADYSDMEDLARGRKSVIVFLLFVIAAMFIGMLIARAAV